MFSCCVCMWKTVFQSYFISFMRPLFSTALQSSFYCVLAFTWWLFVLVEGYQVKFSSERSLLCKIHALSQQKTVLCVGGVLRRFNFVSRDVFSYKFCWYGISVCNFVSSFKWRVMLSGELMFLESYGNCDVTNTPTLRLWRH